MKIISKKSDYYDCIQSYGGFDDTILYIRTKKEINLINEWDTCKYTNNNYWLIDIVVDNIRIKALLLGICGKLYKVITFSNIEKQIKLFAYTTEDIFSIIKLLNSKELTNYFFNNKHRLFFSEENEFKKKNIDNIFKVNNFLKFKKYFEKYKTPIFSVEIKKRNEIKFIKNDLLKKYEFYKVKDPFTMYQELEAYLSSGIFDERVIDKISDEYQLYKKGFNDKSFKSLPTKKKIKKRKN